MCPVFWSWRGRGCLGTVLLCSELTGASDGATSCEAAVFIPQLSLTYAMSQEDKLELEPVLHGGKILPVCFSGKGLVEPKDIQMISCTLLSDSSHHSLPKFLFQSPTWTWYVPEPVLVGMYFIWGMKSRVTVTSSYIIVSDRQDPSYLWCFVGEFYRRTFWQEQEGRTREKWSILYVMSQGICFGGSKKS